MPRYQNPREVMRRKGCVSCCSLPALGFFGLVTLAIRGLIALRKHSN